MLVSSWMQPPPDENFSDRDFFQAHLKPGDKTYYGQVYQSRFGAQPFFTVSRRIEHDGEFVGVLEISVLPSNFFQFFSTLAYTGGLQYALIRDDGLMLARYPAAPAGATNRLGRTYRLSPLDKAIAASAEFTPRRLRSITLSGGLPTAASARRRFT